jgi:protein-histidine N-methyltransferase
MAEFATSGREHEGAAGGRTTSTDKQLSGGGEAAVGGVDPDRGKFLKHFDLERSSHEIFIDWIEKNGGCFPKLYLKEYQEGVRGVHTKASIDANEVVMKIPYKCCITVEMGKETSTGRILLQKRLDTHFDAPKHIFLMLFMMIDGENEDSFLQPYYNILPTALTCMPIFWSDKEYKWLKGSYLLQQIQMRKDAIREDFELICEHDPSFARFGIEYFAWARMIVCSRNFGGVVDGVKTSALVPMADMLNHLRPRETRWGFREESQHFEIAATTPIPTGGVVYDSYGKKCQHRFLLNYGFAVENNVEEDGRSPNELYVQMSLLPKSKDPCYDLKVKILERALGQGDTSRGLRVGMVHKANNTMEAWSFMRFIHLTSEELAHQLERVSAYGHQDLSVQIHSPVSIANEVKCLKSMAKIMLRQLQRYETKYEDDLKLLADPNGPAAFTNRRNTLIYMIGEKEICHFYIDLMKRCVRYFNYDTATVRKEMKAYFATIGDTYDGTAEYMTECVAPLLAQREWELREAQAYFQQHTTQTKTTRRNEGEHVEDKGGDQHGRALSGGKRKQRG